MLPYTPLHHLLLADLAALGAGALVLTSGNVADEPIAYDDDDARERLGGIADLFLVHDRAIHVRVDDSVVRVARSAGRSRPLLIRRSRGYVPRSLGLPLAASRPLLACGAEQKNTFCVARGARAWVGHHIGDLEHYATLSAFRSGIEHFERLFAVEPALVAHDLHPGYLSSAYALERDGVELVGVQHHHAHLAACLAEHGLADAAVGAIYDGTGFGVDGTVWGGELLVGDLRGFERIGSLWPVRMPGGAQAIRAPWRMACSWLTEAFGEPQPLPRSLSGVVEPERWQQVACVGRSELVSPTTTSVGRLFDAVAALCGISPRASYEGQAAVELEAAAAPGARGAYELPALERGRADAPGRPRDGPLRRARRRGGRRCRHDLRALPHGARGGDRLGVCRAGRGSLARHGGAERRRLPEPAPARRGRRSASRSCGCAPSSPVSSRPTTAASPTGRPRSPRRSSAGPAR